VDGPVLLKTDLPLNGLNPSASKNKIFCFFYRIKTLTSMDITNNR
jgi:hypothetical protein